MGQTSNDSTPDLMSYHMALAPTACNEKTRLSGTACLTSVIECADHRAMLIVNKMCPAVGSNWAKCV